jgi:hypothetical protein
VNKTSSAPIMPASCGQISIRLCDTGSGAPISAFCSCAANTSPSERVAGLSRPSVISP